VAFEAVGEAMATRKMTVRNVGRNQVLFINADPLLNGDQTENIDVSDFESLTVQVIGTPGAGFNMNHRYAGDQVNFNSVASVAAVGWANLGANGIPFRGPTFRSEITAGDGTTSITCAILAQRPKS
jgi:hypothetical protein